MRTKIKFDIAWAPGWVSIPLGAWGMSSRFPRVALQSEGQAFSQASQGWLPSLSHWLSRPVWLWRGPGPTQDPSSRFWDPTDSTGPRDSTDSTRLTEQS
jgi:hypothetical protein